MEENDLLPELRSDEMQDILTTPPKALVRWGTTIVLVIVGLLIVGCFVVRYPEVVDCKVTITTTNPPTWVVAKSTGKIKQLYTRDKQKVRRGDIIAVLDNTADTQSILALERSLDAMNITEGAVTLTDLEGGMALGDVQTAYTTLQKAVTAFHNFTHRNVYDKRIATEKAQLNSYDKYVSSMQKQQDISSRQQAIASDQYGREDEIYSKGLISKQEMEDAKMAMLNRRLASEQINTSLHDAEVEMAEIRHIIGELEVQKEQERRAVVADLATAIDQARTAIEEWKQKYALISPMDGTLTYNDYWKVNQNVTEGSKVFSIVSNTSDSIIAKIKIPLEGAGKVQPGQRVNIRLDGYPYLEYGFLTGKVVSLSTMYSDTGEYTATVSLPTPLRTSYHYDIIMGGDLSGVAEVITQDISLAERLIHPLRYIYDRNIRHH
ncbi:MAG: HlyD family efflux transporter periplasmic adaptor subunit [Prevotella sp.]|nr:HlyD family efflux transporter periplasmic adaptor subunit [Prevotella sp.]MBQ4294900.1 HlyD family efflux transporter periplasmic adaptor subunit [Prevotella sp.]